MAAQFSGIAASLCWGYTSAATLRDWTVVASDDGWRLTAAIASVDTFRVSQSSLVFEAPHAVGVFRWPVKDLQMQAGALVATLGPLEG